MLAALAFIAHFIHTVLFSYGKDCRVLLCNILLIDTKSHCIQMNELSSFGLDQYWHWKPLIYVNGFFIFIIA